MPTPDDNKREDRNLLVVIARYSELAFIFPAAVVVGWLLGAALDKWLHTTWIYLAGLLLGIVAGFVQFIRIATTTEKTDGKP